MVYVVSFLLFDCLFVHSFIYFIHLSIHSHFFLFFLLCFFFSLFCFLYIFVVFCCFVFITSCILMYDICSCVHYSRNELHCQLLFVSRSFQFRIVFKVDNISDWQKYDMALCNSDIFTCENLDRLSVSASYHHQLLNSSVAGII